MRLFLAQFIIRSFANIHFRGKYRLLHFFVPKNIVIEDSLFGYKIKLDLSDWIQRNIYLRASYRDDTLIIKNILKSGMTFVDIGANIGYFSILASSIVGDEGLVLAFEPNKKLHSKLMETIKINSIKNMKLYNSALGDSEGETFLFTNHEDKNNYTSTLVNMGQKEKFKIEINTLDNILEKLNINQVDYMKVDVDGYEPNILRGVKNALGLKKIKICS